MPVAFAFRRARPHSGVCGPEHSAVPQIERGEGEQRAFRGEVLSDAASNVIPLRPEPSGFGDCPTCGRNSGYLNVGREHWFFCRIHRLKWCAGDNLMSTWRNETDADWERNSAFLSSYIPVPPTTDAAWWWS